MGQKAEEQKVCTVKGSTSIRDMTRKLIKEIDIKRWDLPFMLLKWEKLFNIRLSHPQAPIFVPFGGCIKRLK